MSARWSPWVLVLLLAASPAHGVDKQACAEAFERSQELRGEGKLRAARDRLRQCAGATCPSFVQRECTRLLPEVESGLPSLLIEARGADGGEDRDAVVRLDGERVERAAGLAIEVDPGEHTLRVERRGARDQEQRITAREGEKRRLIVIPYEPLTPPAAASSASPGAASSGRSRPTVAYALAGVGALGLASFGYFAATGASDYNDLDGRCAPACPRSETDAVRRKFLIADVSLGVGVLSLAAATYFFLRSDDGTRAASLRVGPQGASLGAAFAF